MAKLIFGFRDASPVKKRLSTGLRMLLRGNEVKHASVPPASPPTDSKSDDEGKKEPDVVAKICSSSPTSTKLSRDKILHNKGRLTDDDDEVVGSAETMLEKSGSQPYSSFSSSSKGSEGLGTKTKPNFMCLRSETEPDFYKSFGTFVELVSAEDDDHPHSSGKRTIGSPNGSPGRIRHRFEEEESEDGDEEEETGKNQKEELGAEKQLRTLSSMAVAIALGGEDDVFDPSSIVPDPPSATTPQPLVDSKEADGFGEEVSSKYSASDHENPSIRLLIKPGRSNPNILVVKGTELQNQLAD